MQQPPINSQEHPFVFTAVVPDARNPIIVHLTAATHYVVGLTNYQGETIGHTYTGQDYSQLNNLPYKDGYRNLFSSNGLVKGSKRLERFLLWPMGVPSAGAMRQKGHHLTAFVGNKALRRCRSVYTRIYLSARRKLHAVTHFFHIGSGIELICIRRCLQRID